jgi:hypothetical protein
MHANKFTNASAWCLADFNADGSTDGQDFIIWNEHKFMSSVAAAAVPEPVSVAWVRGCIGLFSSRRRRWPSHGGLVAEGLCARNAG